MLPALAAAGTPGLEQLKGTPNSDPGWHGSGPEVQAVPFIAAHPRLPEAGCSWEPGPKAGVEIAEMLKGKAGQLVFTSRTLCRVCPGGRGPTARVRELRYPAVHGHSLLRKQNPGFAGWRLPGLGAGDCHVLAECLRWEAAGISTGGVLLRALLQPP